MSHTVFFPNCDIDALNSGYSVNIIPERITAEIREVVMPCPDLPRSTQQKSPVSFTHQEKQLGGFIASRSFRSNGPNITAKISPLKLSTSPKTLNFRKVEKESKTKTSIRIPESSPLYPLQNLQVGWDGYWAEPLSEALLERAQGVWDLIKAGNPKESQLPSVSPGANASVAFSWTSYYPSKELEVWIYDQPDFYAEWLLSTEDNEDEGIAESSAELFEIIERFQKL
jgi:hypothetical protein